MEITTPTSRKSKPENVFARCQVIYAHPNYPMVLASGFLGGYVCVWDIVSRGNEIWRTDRVIASLAFHPFDRLLVIGKLFLEIYKKAIFKYL